MTEQMFEKLIQTLSEHDLFDWSGIILPIVIPIVFAIWTSKREAKKVADEVVEQNRILDERQERLEEIQKSISANLEELTNLVKEIKKSNLLQLQKEYPIFFDIIDKFDYMYIPVKRQVNEFHKEIYLKKKLSEEQVDFYFGFIEDILEDELQHIDHKIVPPLLYSSFDELLRNINSVGNLLDNFTEERCIYFIMEKFPKIQKSYEDLRKIAGI